MCSLCAAHEAELVKAEAQAEGRRKRGEATVLEGQCEGRNSRKGTVKSLLDPSPESPPHAGETGTARPPRRAQHAIGHAVFTHRDFFVQIPSRGRGGDEN